MKKSEVYSWRLSPETKAQLEDRARAEGMTMAKLLDRIVGGWLETKAAADEEEEQRRLHAAAAKAIGTIRGGDPTASSRVKEIVGDAIEEKFERRRARRPPPPSPGPRSRDG